MADLIPRDAALEVVAVMICLPSVKIAAEHRIDALPAVDAIPMDWLLDVIHDGDPELSKAAAKVKREWEWERRMRGKGI